MTLERGELETEVEELMEVEEIPPTQEVLDAVSCLRSGGGYARMQLDLPWEVDAGGGASSGPIVVVDTNVLISHLALLREFADLALSAPLPASHRPTLLIPHVVVAELDGLKSSTRPAEPSRGGSSARATSSIASLARAATNWLLHAVAPGGLGGVVRGQRKSETLYDAEGVPLGENNDSLVLDAALYHAHRAQAGRVVLLTDDRNLQLRATIEQVEAFGIEGGLNAQGLLEKLALPAGSTGPARHDRHCASPPSLRPDQSRHTSPTKTGRRRSPPPRPAPLPPPPPLVPTPARPARPPRTASMELDPPTPPPMHLYLEPPPLYPAQSPSDMFRNASALLTHFLALPLYRHAFEHLRRTRIAEQGAWQVALGDWREWGARECVEAARRWWSEGDIEGLCRIGLEEAAKHIPLPSPPPRGDAIHSPRSADRAAAPSNSRWASQASTRAPAPTPATHPPSAPRRAPPPVSQQLRDLHTSLPILASALSVPAESTISWSAPRWEVLLEGFGALLLAVLGGAVRGNVHHEVGRIVAEWVEQLAGLGVRVEVAV